MYFQMPNAVQFPFIHYVQRLPKYFFLGVVRHLRYKIHGIRKGVEQQQTLDRYVKYSFHE